MGRLKPLKLTPAQQQLVSDNLGLVYCRLVPLRGNTNPELIEALEFEALRVLCRVAAKFQEGRGCKFSTFATVSIKRAFINIYRQWQNRKLRPVPLTTTSIPDYRGVGESESEREGQRRYCHRLIDAVESEDARAATLLRYCTQGLTMVEIGQRLGLSREQAQRLYYKALTLVRRVSVNQSREQAA